MADRPQPHAPMGRQENTPQMSGVANVPIDTKTLVDPQIQNGSESSNSPVSHPSTTAVTPVHIPGPAPVPTASLSTPVSTPLSSHQLSTSGQPQAGGQINSSPPPSRRTRFKWLPDYEQTVFNSFRDSIRDGLQGESTMRSEAWTRALEAMNSKHGIQLLKRQIVSKFDNTKSKYRTWCLLKREPGFTFDHRTRRFSASNEVWDRYLQAHPEAACFRTAPLEYEELLNEIYSRVAFYTPSRTNASFVVMQVQPQQSPLSASPSVMSTAAAAVAAASHSNDNLSSPSQSRVIAPHQPLRTINPNRGSLASTVVSSTPPILSRPVSDQDTTSSALSSSDPSLPSLSMGGLHASPDIIGKAESFGTSNPGHPVGMFDNTKWVEQAMDLFLSEFPTESPSVQLRALRKFDTITTAIMFCKIGPDVRRMWVQEIQEQVRQEDREKAAKEERNNYELLEKRDDGVVGGASLGPPSGLGANVGDMEGIAAAATATMTTSQ